ncbi:MAG: adenylate/guanylate cyclase domain-containing protein [Elusimicrobia bacterium]|nr:adenylate/guanylate cyclase domain-containing protein [Elusimicrobiota bacterium]
MISPSCAIFRFPAELNDAFLREYGQRSVRVVRMAVIIALGICLLLEFWPHAQKSARGQLIYLTVNVPGLLVWFGLTFWPSARRYLHVISSTAGFLVLGAGTMAFVYYIPEIAARHQPQAALLVTALFYSAIRLPFLWASSLGWCYFALFAICVGSWRAMPADQFRLSLAYLLSANILGMYVAYALEAAMRIDFLRRREIATEQERSERLLLNVLPAPIAERLKAGETPIADDFKDATILFADIVGYTGLAGKMKPAELVAILNDVFSRFDRLCDEHGVEKIKTIGDAYMAVGGVPRPLAAHADTMAVVALGMLREVAALNRERGLALSVRIGLHSGPVVAGIIGDRKFSYDLWGDAVNVASRMESHGVPGAVHLTEAVAAGLGDGRRPEKRGIVELKGKGPMTTYLLRAAP